jgi:uracil-DNA glycosylase
MDNKEIENFYTNCMNCQLNCNYPIYNNRAKGVPPRGFYFKKIPIEILVVAKNPGHPLENEKILFKNKYGKELFNSYRNFQDELYSNILLNKEKSTTFHKNLFEYISIILDIPNNVNEIYQHIAHTNLVKCSTIDEQQKLNNSLIDPCYNMYFLDEIKYLQPKIILALGREVEKYLLNKNDQIKIPIIYIKHPSYHYKREEKNKILLNIKKKINNILKKNN